MRKGDLFVLSCASVRRVFLKRVCSSLFMGGAGWFMILFGLSDCMCLSTIEWCISLMLCWTAVSVVLVGLASRFVANEVFWKIVCFICRRLGFCFVSE